MKVNRERFLQVLRSVSPALAQQNKQTTGQSDCLVFKDGRLFTLNEDIACSVPSMLEKDLSCAIKAKKLMEMLEKLPDDEINIYRKDNQLHINNKIKDGKHSTPRMYKAVLETSISMPIEAIEIPKDDEWFSVHEDFREASSIVCSCTGTDETRFVFTCVHVTDEWMEACDDVQFVRYNLPTGVKEPFLVRGSILKHIVKMEPSEMATTDTWIHFRSGSGLVLSCRRYLEVDEVPDYSGLLQEKITNSLTLPKGLAEASMRADIVSSENADNKVKVELKSGKLRIKGEGVSGEYTEVRKVEYEGDGLSFLISPKLLKTIVEKHNDCRISKSKLKVDGGRWVFMACLGIEEDNEESAE